MSTPTSTLHPNVKKLAPDLTKGFPHSPHAMLGGYVLAKRAVDKCRAGLAGTIGEYHDDCPLDNIFLGFAGIKFADLKDLLATGADDAAVSQWIEKNATKRPRIEIIKWNNSWRYKRLSETPDEMQEFMEDYIPKNVQPAVIHHIRYFFDIFDAEEKRFTH
jgi:Domain of unknown function (DUF5069)